MELYIINSEESFYYPEELRIFGNFIENDIIFGKNYFSYTDNFVSIHTIEPFSSSLLKRVVFCRGEYSTKTDEMTAYTVFNKSAEAIILEYANEKDNYCRIARPIRVNDMYLLMSFLKFDDMFTFILCKTSTKTTDYLNVAVAGTCALLHISHTILTEMQGDEPPEVTLEDYITSTENKSVANTINYWFNTKPPVVQEWLKRIEKETREQQERQDNDDEQ